MNSMNILVELDRLIKTEANVIAVLPERESTIATVIEASTRSTGVVVIVSPNLTGVARALSLLPAAIQARTLLIGPGLTHAELDLRQMDIEAHRYAIVCITPGRLQSFPLVRALGEASVTRVICLDSASIHQGSGRFYPEYGIIFELLSLLNDPPVIFFSTTATRRSLDDISNRLSRRPVVLLGDIVPRTAFLIINKCCDEENRLAKLTRLVANRHGSGIVYVNSRQQGYRVEQRLRQGGSSVRLYHAGLGSAERAAIVDRFQSAEVPILVATHAYVQTDALPVLRYIIHYSPPPSLDLYVRNIAALGLHDKISLSCVLTMADEDDELRRWSRKAFVSADCLEAVYNALSIAIAGPVGLVDEGAVLDLVSQQGYDDIDLWLCISLLERAGVVRRGFDAPRAATVLIRDSGLTGDDVEWAQ